MKRRFGAHLPTADGMRYVVIHARALGVEAVQIMLGEGHSWTPYKLSADVVNDFRKLIYGVAVYVHLPYTLNPCVPKGHPHFKLQKSVLRRYLDLADAVGATACVLHPGYKKELSDIAAMQNFIAFMDDVQTNMDFECRILFETDSGSKNGSKVGDPDFIHNALLKLGRAKFGMCIDTEHLWARGINLFDDAVRKDFLEDYGPMIELVHLNAPDPGVELGSFVDKHSIPFAEFPVESANMIKDLVLNYPAVLERRSLSVIEQDITLVSSLVPSIPASIDITLEEEVNDHGNEGHID